MEIDSYIYVRNMGNRENGVVRNEQCYEDKDEVVVRGGEIE